MPTVRGDVRRSDREPAAPDAGSHHARDEAPATWGSPGPGMSPDGMLRAYQDITLGSREGHGVRAGARMRADSATY